MTALRRELFWLVLGFLILSLGAGTLWADGSPLWGRQVSEIRLESTPPLSVGEFKSQIVQETGEPLDPAKVEASLKNLYSTGRFLDLRADADAQGASVVLVFRARARYFVGDVIVKGAPKHVRASTLVSASRLRLGYAITPDDLPQASDQIASVLRDNAYYQAQVKATFVPDPQTQEANVIFTIIPGKPATIRRVAFPGLPAASTAHLQAIAGWRVGKQMTSSRLENGISRIRNYYQKRGRLQAAVNVERRVFDPVGRAEDLIVKVETGPQIKVQVRGARISSSALRRVLPVFEEGATDDLALDSGDNTLEDYFARRGYFLAQSNHQRMVAPGSQNVDINYYIRKGPRGKFVGFAFQGNRAIPSADLSTLIEISPADFPQSWRGFFDTAALNRGVQSITAYYQSKGYLDAHVTPQLNNHYEDEPSHLFVTFQISEGALTRVGKLNIRGLDTQAENAIRSRLASQPGHAYSAAIAQSDRDLILTYLSNHGYSLATATWEATAPSPDHTVDLSFNVAPGSPETIRNVIIVGNAHTRAGAIFHQLTFGPGEDLSHSKFLDSQQRLYDLELFNQVQITPQNPTGSETDKSVLVDVEEARRWTVGYGGGVDVQSLPGPLGQNHYKGSPRVSLELDRLDVGGRPQTFSLLGHISNLESIGSSSYTIPQFLNHRDLSLRIAALVDQSRDVLTFNSKRQEASLTVQKKYSASTSLLARFSYRRVSVDPSSLRIQPAAIPLFSQPVRVAMLSTSYVNDHRDNPADATRGSYSFVDAGVAWNKWGSQANFVRLAGQNSTYYRLTPSLTFARDTRFGVESPFGTPAVSDTGAATPAIPLPERFFMGGSESHRGFALNEAGPLDPVTGFPVGGDALFLNTFELRARFEENRFGLVLFHDAGNVYSDIDRMRLLKVSQGPPTDFDYTVHAVGIGFRYRTPIAPLRFDVSYCLNPPRYQLPAGQGVEVHRLPWIQYFVSIGQSF